MKETKKQKIKDWILSGKPITALMAVQMFNCVNLSGIIIKLRREGICIDTENIISHDGSRFARYILSK